MPVSTIIQARDEINARLLAALTAASLQNTYIAWPDLPVDQPLGDDTITPPAESPPGSPWLHAVLRHAEARIATLGGTDGSRRHRSLGTLIVQIFTPRGDAMQRAYAFGDALILGFSRGGGTPSGVQFANARVREIGTDGSWQQTNFLVDFEYDKFVGP